MSVVLQQVAVSECGPYSLYGIPPKVQKLKARIVVNSLSLSTLYLLEACVIIDSYPYLLFM